MSRTPWLTIVALALALLAGNARALDRDRPFHDFVRGQWGIAEGLPQVSVLSLVQDDGGYVWVGTQNGVARFDGMRFTAMSGTAVGGPAITMARDAIRDRAGNIWFAHERGLLRHDGRTATVFSTRPAAMVAHGVAQTPDGAIVAATEAGLFTVQGDQLEPAALQGTALFSIALAQDGALWLGADAAVWRVAGGEARRIALPLPPGTPVAAIAATTEALWIGSAAGLYRLDPRATGEPQPTAVTEPVHALLQDAGGTLWIGTTGALWRSRSDGRLDRHGEAAFVRNPWVAALFEDRDGNLWVGTENESLFRLSDGWVSHVGQGSGMTDLLSWSVVHAPDGALVVGTNSDVVRIVDGRAERLVDGTRLPNPVAYELAYDPRGRLWIGTRGGLARLDAPGADPVPIEALGRAQVNAIVPTDDDEAWFGTSAGAFRWRDGVAMRMSPPMDGPEGRVRGVLPLGGERALLATEGGVRLLEEGRLSTPPWSQPVDGAFVTAIDRVLPDLTIVSTIDRGFGVLVADRLQMVDDVPELSLLTAWGARLVGQHVFVAAAEGVVSLPVDELRGWWRNRSARLDWRVPASIAGNLRGSQRTRCCNGGGRSRMAVDGQRIWLPTIDGVVALDLLDLERSVETPVVHIESASHDGQSLKPDTAGSPVVVDGPGRDLAVRFTAIAHRDPNGLRFAYRLDGFDRDWVDAGARREAFYTNLPPGDFTFRVRAESAARLGSPEDATLLVRVPPRWLERTGTRLGLLVGAMALLFMLLRAALGWRERAFAAREARLTREVEERTAELAHANAQLRAANRALAQESETDPLTGLPNRRWLLSHLGDWLRADDDGDDACTVLAMFDLDRFQEINTRHGRTAGDALLRQFGALLRQLAGPQGTVVRWGGEDFLVLQRGVPRAEATTRAAVLWRAAQEHLHPTPDGTPVLLPCSVGYALWPPARDAVGVPWSVAVEMADAAAWRVRAEARKGFGGLLLADGADPALLSGGIVGRLDALLRGGVLLWERRDAAPRAPG